MLPLHSSRLWEVLRGDLPLPGELPALVGHACDRFLAVPLGLPSPALALLRSVPLPSDLLAHLVALAPSLLDPDVVPALLAQPSCDRTHLDLLVRSWAGSSPSPAALSPLSEAARSSRSRPLRLGVLALSATPVPAADALPFASSLDRLVPGAALEVLEALVEGEALPLGRARLLLLADVAVRSLTPPRR